jgi:hypothetical protein
LRGRLADAAFTFACGVLLGLIICAYAEAYTFGPTVTQTGPEKTVFDWSAQNCTNAEVSGRYHVPDLPAHAFKDNEGKVQLIISQTQSARMRGSSLDSLALECPTIFRSTRSPWPASFDNIEWLVAPYILPDGRIFALVHNEFEGWTVPGACLTQGRYDAKCWYNSITLAFSGSNGRDYVNYKPAPGHLVASSPYPYSANSSPQGYFGPSNMVYAGGYWYFFSRVEAYGAQRWGSCLLRSPQPWPGTWQVWTSGGWKPAKYSVCEPIQGIQAMEQSLTWNSYYKKYMLAGFGNVPATGGWNWQYTLSDDLIHWGPLQLLMKIQAGNEPCPGPDGDRILAYPSIIDPDSTSRNYETADQTAYLFFVKSNMVCSGQPRDRDLVRIPIRFQG